MAGIFKPQGSFAITPHKVSVCVLVQIYASPSGHFLLPAPFSSIPQHNRFGLFLLALTKSCDDILEPKLDKLISQLREICGLLGSQLVDELTSKLTSLASPDDLFNFFIDLRGIVGGVDSEDDQISLDPSSNLGTFIRRCLLAFNLLSFEGVCHLLSDIELYCTEGTIPGSFSFDMSNLDDPNNETKAFCGYENMEFENFSFGKVCEEVNSSSTSKEMSYHLHTPEALRTWVKGVDFSAGLSSKHKAMSREVDTFFPKFGAFQDSNANAGVFLRSIWQMQQYLLEQADDLVKQGSSVPFNALETSLRQMQKLAPELHRVHFLRHSNNLHHDDYTGALENLHRYFDYCAGMEGFDLVSSLTGEGRYEIGLLCLGTMQFHFGHPDKALEILTEAVWVSQQHNNDSCLAHTLTTICNLLSEFGITSTDRVLGSSSYSPVTGVGASLTIQQQLFVLLKRSLHLSESLKLTQLTASNHLTMAKFGMRHVQRPLLSFGPKTSLDLRSCPANVCKDLRLSFRVICEFTSETCAVSSSEGALSNAWLGNFQTSACPFAPNLFDNSTRNNNAILFCSQPCSIPGSVLQVVGSSCLLRATAWEIYGSASLAQINALAYVSNYADGSSSSDDLALAYVKLVQHLAISKGYKEALAALTIVEGKFLGISKSRILRLKLQLSHDLAIHRGQVKLAQQLCDELGVLASSVTGVDMELKVEAGLRHARTLLAGKQYSWAAEVASSLFCMCYKFNLQVENASVLLLLAEIHKKSGNPVVGLPYVLASLSFCLSYNLDLLKASATLTLAELWLALGSCEAKAALNLLYGSFPMIFSHGGLELRARARIIEVKCYLSEPLYSVSEEPEILLDSLNEACNELSVLEDHELAAEAFYLTAIVHDKLGNLGEREAAAASFKQHILVLQYSQQGLEDCLVTFS